MCPATAAFLRQWWGSRASLTVPSIPSASFYTSLRSLLWQLAIPAGALVVTYIEAVAVEVARDTGNGLTSLAPELALGATLAPPLHYLDALAVQHAPSPLLHRCPRFRLAFPMEGVSCRPQLRQDMLKIQHQRDTFQVTAHSLLQGMLSIGEHDPLLGMTRVTPVHLYGLSL
jgi:hypothetical protein